MIYHLKQINLICLFSSDSEFDECSELAGTCALITGQPGNGKSAAVYSIAEELGLHVLEVNASSCRTGKQVRVQLCIV